MKKILMLLLISTTVSINSAEYKLKIEESNYKNTIRILDSNESENGGSNGYKAGDFVVGDWKAEGDNLVILDASTGLEWLKLTETDGKSIAAVKSELSTTYLGWRQPTEYEVNNMMLNYFSTHNETEGTEITIKTTENDPLLLNFVNIFGNLYSEGSIPYSLGFYEAAGTFKVKQTGVDIHGSPLEGYIYHSRSYGFDINTVSNHVSGVWLVNEGGVSLFSLNNPSINIPKN